MQTVSKSIGITTWWFGFIGFLVNGRSVINWVNQYAVILRVTIDQKLILLYFVLDYVCRGRFVSNPTDVSYAHSKHDKFLLWVSQQIDESGVLIDYHKREADNLTKEGTRLLYVTIHRFGTNIFKLLKAVVFMIVCRPH